MFAQGHNAITPLRQPKICLLFTDVQTLYLQCNKPSIDRCSTAVQQVDGLDWMNFWVGWGTEHHISPRVLCNLWILAFQKTIFSILQKWGLSVTSIDMTPFQWGWCRNSMRKYCPHIMLGINIEEIYATSSIAHCTFDKLWFRFMEDFLSFKSRSSIDN